jgi:translation initiation factor 2 beta subunit (eIF-2beta)/eIF-5
MFVADRQALNKKFQRLANTEDSINSLAKAITTDTTKLAQVKQVIQKYIKEY